jgi:glyoxylase-like metal-dependent hydrolase (beta-lactamase superfamily II)
MADFDPAHVEPGGHAHHYPGGPLTVTKLSVGPYDNNSYLLADSESGDALLVDAANEPERLLELLAGVRLIGVVTTHRHPDHIQGLPAILQAHDVWNGAHPADADEIASQVGVRPDRPLEDGDTIAIGRFEVGVLHTPGHTPGSICFRLPSDQLLTGDAVFPGGVGKTEGTKAFEQAIDSFERRVLPLGEDTRISPGHGDDTWIGNEAPHLDEWKARGW